jgi:pimeloyl-ACP methyl ester carboxylesterase
MPHLVCDGVRLHFEETGRGVPPLLFVHGWTCNQTMFAPQVAAFQERHRVVAVDLRGHGQSDKPEQAYTMTAFADDLAWLCRELEIERPVVIGHSMGGLIALTLAAHHPAVPGAIVTIDSPILPAKAVVGNLAPLLEALRGPGFREAQRAFVSSMLFIPTDNPAIKERVIGIMNSAPQHVMASAFENMFAPDHAALAAACRVPWLALYAAHPATDLLELRRRCPHVVTGQTVGAGHFPQLEVPEQVNTMIMRFLVVGGIAACA